MIEDKLSLAAREKRGAYFAAEADLMEKLAHGQSPQVLYIGCSDSQIMPSRILGAAPGDIFVVRNLANVVPPADAPAPSLGATLEYAMMYLQVKHIVVCGHSFCGGIQALDLPPDEREPHLSHWLAYAREAKRRIPEKLKGHARHNAIIEANVLLQVEHLMSYDYVKAAAAAGEVEIHAWVYDFRSGRVRIYDDVTGIFVEEPPFDLLAELEEAV
ncbi:MAG: carbonic anhydrase [Anaerolineales bacterium]